MLVIIVHGAGSLTVSLAHEGSAGVAPARVHAALQEARADHTGAELDAAMDVLSAAQLLV